MANKGKIGKYTILFPIKRSGYADTYRVADEKGNKYFLKLFHLHMLKSTQYNKGVEDITEINITRQLRHVNMETLIESGLVVYQGEKCAYMTCEYIVGETVSEKIKREKGCSVYDLKQIVCGVLDGLRYLHNQRCPIIHNEITPENVMLDLSKSVMVPKLIDFGHAQILDDKLRPFYIDGINPFYVAPEVFKGLYSVRTDLYSVGAMMYHLLYGIEPWSIDLENVQEDERVKRILQERRSPLRIPDVKIFELEDSLLNIIAKALSQDANDRFQSADEFIKAINGEFEIDKTEYEKVDKKENTDEKKSALKKNIRKGNGFADVAGMEELKSRLNTEVIDLIRNPEKYKKLRVKIPNGILLYGPPGCGKTFIAEKFAEEMGCNYMYVHCSDVASPYIHGGQEKIAAIFNKAKENAPTILFLDELDAMIADRSRHNNVSEYGEVNEFLAQLNNCADNHVFVIGATNNPKGIDSAALRSGRLDIKVYVPAPNKEEREQLLRLYLKDICTDDIIYSILAEKTAGYVSKDVCSLVNHAARKTAQADQELISMQTLLDTIEEYKKQLPSVPKSVLKQHERIREEFEGGVDRKIGFV